MTTRAPFTTESRIETNPGYSRLLFLVGGIAVVSIINTLSYEGDIYIIDLPIDTRLPVSRDDVILGKQ